MCLQGKGSSPHLEVLGFKDKALIYANILHVLRVIFHLTSE